jgi:phosphonate transport system permease protein
MSSSAINQSASVAQLHANFAAMERRRRFYSAIFIVVTVAVVFGGFNLAESLNSGGFVQGLSQFFDYPAGIVEETIESDEWSDYFVGFVPAMIETINMAAVSTIFGTLLAIVLAFGGSSNLGVIRWLVPVCRRIMDITRAFPELIIALFLIFILGATPVPAIIAVAFHTAGALGKLFSEVNENIDKKPLEGLQATGATWFQRMRYGVIPQVLPNYLSYTLLRFEINIRASAILGFVGAGGIGAELRKSISWGAGDQISALFLLLFITIVTIDQISSRLRQRIVGSSFHMA